MAKRKHKRETEQRFACIARTVAQSASPVEDAEARPTSNHHDVPLSDGEIAASAALSSLTFSSASQELTKMKKFRFQLLHQWIVSRIQPCRVADVGGGKGLLAYLLQESGWAATVIDPVAQALPAKYKDLESNRQVRGRHAPLEVGMGGTFCRLSSSQIK